MFFLRRVVILAAGCLLLSSFATPAAAQSVASGTIEGTVVDPTGAVVAGAAVEIRNPISRYQQTTTTDSMGAFRFTNLPLNPYHVEVMAPGFAAAAQDVTVRTTVPISIKVSLTVAGEIGRAHV